MLEPLIVCTDDEKVYKRNLNCKMEDAEAIGFWRDILKKFIVTNNMGISLSDKENMVIVKERKKKKKSSKKKKKKK